MYSLKHQLGTILMEFADSTMLKKICQRSGAVASPKAPGSKPGSAMPNPNQPESPLRPSHSTHAVGWKKRCKKDEATDIGTRRMEKEPKGTSSKKIGLHRCRAKVTLIDHIGLPVPGAGRSPPSSVGRAQLSLWS